MEQPLAVLSKLTNLIQKTAIVIKVTMMTMKTRNPSLKTKIVNLVISIIRMRTTWKISLMQTISTKKNKSKAISNSEGTKKTSVAARAANA